MIGLVPQSCRDTIILMNLKILSFLLMSRILCILLSCFNYFKTIKTMHWPVRLLRLLILSLIKSLHPRRKGQNYVVTMVISEKQA